MAPLFTTEAFAFFDGLESSPTKAYFNANRTMFKEFVESPFRQLFERIMAELPPSITDTLETKRDLYSRIPKNDFGRGGAWPFYWAAMHPPQESRIASPQLYMMVHKEGVEFGFALGTRGTAYEERLIANFRNHRSELIELLRERMTAIPFVFGNRDVTGGRSPDFEGWLIDPTELGPAATRGVPRAEAMGMGIAELASVGRDAYERLYPFMILATLDSPMPAVRADLQQGDGMIEALPIQPRFTLVDCAAETGMKDEMLETWVRAIERHGQAIVYGPPGTGKTFVSERIARHLTSETDGFTELVQFHPAYEYEDFLQGIRPRVAEEGALDFAMMPGRFLEFCRRAELRGGRCVLIIDEINRANLSRVFGELMYLMEYRGRDIPLAGGERFSIPKNVRILGTMNTADRSIALVDHALRRRFAFLPLYPDFDVLRGYHENSDFDVEPLVELLRSVNATIGDRHYELGISFFMRPEIEQELPDVWRTQIEPYLEEYFFDQPAKAEAFRWEQVAPQLRLT